MNTVLFDLDGTLLPMQQQAFLHRYMDLLGLKAKSHGVDPQAMITALWSGTAAMVRNDGAVSNHHRFWDRFAAELGEDIRHLEPIFDAFYGEEFDAVREVVQPNPYAREVMDLLHAKGYTVALATNPLFPPTAMDTRLHWVGLKRADFVYISDYLNSCYCKPQAGYFQAVLKELGKRPEDALMVGNSITEDMPAAALGLQVYLVTDFMEGEGDQNRYPHGSFAELAAYARQLPAVQ